MTKNIKVFNKPLQLMLFDYYILKNATDKQACGAFIYSIGQFINSLSINLKLSFALHYVLLSGAAATQSMDNCCSRQQVHRYAVKGRHSISYRLNGHCHWWLLMTFVIIFNLIFPFILHAQQSNLHFEHISLDQGLSQSIVSVIHKDRKGFMWIGTESGLNKYDGYDFAVYKYNPFDSTSISNNQILSICEDHAGNLWIGTAGGGLNRFDREREIFFHYTHHEHDSTSLSGHTVPFIAEDSKGNLWVITNGGGIDRLNRETEKFIHYRNNPADSTSLSDDVIRTVFEDQAGNLWIGTSQGLNKYERERDCFIRYFHEPGNPNSLSYNDISSLNELPAEPGILWIGTADRQNFSTGGGLNRLDIKTGQFKHFKHHPADPQSINSNLVGQVLEDKDGMIWVATARGLDRFDRGTETFTHFLPNPANPRNWDNAIRTITQDITGALWITTFAIDGIYRFNREKLTFTHYAHDPANPHSLSQNIIQTIYEDTTGVLWIGTNTGGLNKVDQYAQKFETYSSDLNDPQTISGNVVRSFNEDSWGQLWVGTSNGGLNKFNPQRKRITHYRFNPRSDNSLSDNRVWALSIDRTGVLWVGTFGDGLNRYDPEHDHFIRYRHDPKNPYSLSNNVIRAIFEDESGTLWIGTDDGGLNRFNSKTENFTHYANDPNDPNSLTNNSVRAIAQDQSGVLWIGTFGGGLNKLVLKKGKDLVETAPEILEPGKKIFTHYQYNPDDPTSLSNNSIQSIYIDATGILWIGTFGGGLNRFDPVTEKFEHFTEQNSDLSNNVIYGVLGDDHGNIWVSSNRGISKYDPKTNIFTNYDTDDGLQSKEFNGQACYKNKRGEMFFGGINGFNVFHPDSIRDNPYEPQMAITDFKLFGESVPIGRNSPLKKHISETAEIKLAYWQNNISFDFVALHYNRPEKNEYSYILVNYDQSWHHTGERRTATYTNLDPGEYIFRVRGSNNDGVWNKKGATIHIIITPPWWKTIRAYILYVLLIGTLLVASYRIQRRLVLRSERSRTQIREAELRAQAAEAQARAIQAEHERKTHELEEARKLQLSMLPKKLPQAPNLEIAVHMQTATEVGGDYYDFHLDDNGCLTVVIGDATGHGLNAGTMVSVIKSLFIANAPRSDIKTFFENCTRTIRQLHLGNLYMGLALVKIENNELVASAAGMPPLYIFRSRTGSVEEIILKGMPLGVVDDFVYEDKQIKLSNGDTILLLSDGLPELFNNEKEMFDYHRVKKTFEQVGDQRPEEIINHFIEVAEDWRKGNPQQDDVTFVVLKMKENGK